MRLDAPHVGRTLALALRLGPWASPSMLRGTAFRTLTVQPTSREDRPFELRVYHPRRRTVGTFLIAPGMQPFGTGDAKMDRFARTLAFAGYRVLVPYLPDHLRLLVSPRSVRDFRRAYETATSLPDGAGHGPPAVFSISIGSHVAVSLASDPTASVREVFLFGGFLRWTECIRFALGEGGRVDSLVRPAVFMNLVDFIPEAAGAGGLLQDAWLEFVRSTWASPRKRDPELPGEVAEERLRGLPGKVRDLFLVGCGLRGGGEDLCREALRRAEDALEAVDLTRWTARVRCPVHVIHGADDDVIPSDQGDKLYQALSGSSRRQRYRSRLYRHSDAGGLAGFLRRPGSVLRDLVTHLRFMHALAGS